MASRDIQIKYILFYLHFSLVKVTIIYQAALVRTDSQKYNRHIYINYKEVQKKMYIKSGVELENIKKEFKLKMHNIYVLCGE